LEIHRGKPAAETLNSAPHFTGTVRRDALVTMPEPGRLQAALVSFEPGARTDWHTHPCGQMLLIVDGRCRTQTLGGPIKELIAGDVVWFAPGETHWHGAAPDAAMSHLAIQEALDGVNADWLDPVTDAQYLGEG
jgi:quercetin dioxygenase-like cupin family protein